MIHIHVDPLRLKLEDPFKLSYGATTVRENVLVHLTVGKYRGVGEAAVVPYYGETPQRVIQYFSLPHLPALLQEWDRGIEPVLEKLPPTPSMAALNALDMALHDLWGQQLGQPLYRLWGLNPHHSPQNTYTVAMADSDAAYQEKLRAAQGYPLIKLKLGSDTLEHDLAMVQVARRMVTARLCVDANAAWSVETALKIIPKLAQLDIVLIEQPLAKDDLDGWRTLKAKLPNQMPPLIADESVQGLDSLKQLVGIVDGINIKLAKCGGLHIARQMITAARLYGMKIMLGCMIETSVGITAAAHLAPLVDYVDLDGNLLITNDPYLGVKSVAGQLILPETAGLGVQRRD